MRAPAIRVSASAPDDWKDRARALIDERQDITDAERQQLRDALERAEIVEGGQ